MIREIFRYRKYIINNSIGELKYRYAGSVIGVLWNVLNPLFQILVYTFVFSNIMLAKLPGMETTSAFAIYLCSGLLAWIAFSEVLNRGTSAFIENGTFLKKLPIPEHVFLTQIVTSTALNVGITYAMLALCVFVITGVLTLSWILVPVVLLLLLILGFGIALSLSCLNVFFRDLSQIMNIITSIWMWLTPIVYVKEIVPDEYRNVYLFNPIYPFINSLQQLIVYGNIPTMSSWAAMIIIATISVVVGYSILSKLRKEVRDNL